MVTLLFSIKNLQLLKEIRTRLTIYFFIMIFISFILFQLFASNKLLYFFQILLSNTWQEQTYLQKEAQQFFECILSSLKKDLLEKSNNSLE